MKDNYLASRKSLFQWYRQYPDAREAIIDHRKIGSTDEIAFRVLDNASRIILGDDEYVGLVHHSNCCKIVYREAFDSLMADCGYVKKLDEFWLLIDVIPENVWERLYDLAQSSYVIRYYHRTFILRWNTEISHLKLGDAAEMIYKIRENDKLYIWPLWAYEEAHIGDRFYMIRTGYGGQEGIVMRGYFKSEPEEGDGPGFEGKHFVRMVVEDVLNPATASKLITISQLQSIIPDFNWQEGHSGELLSAEQARALDQLWADTLCLTL